MDDVGLSVRMRTGQNIVTEDDAHVREKKCAAMLYFIYIFLIQV